MLASLARATAGSTVATALRRLTTGALLLGVVCALSGCDYALMDPKGPIGVQERTIILFATGLMLIVVIPVIAMTFLFAWRYRASNTTADYRPDWEHSNAIEAVVWIVPCLIIGALGTVTWITSHTLDPYRPIASPARPVEVQVVSLDWKWLFIYPDLGIASVNEFAFPSGTPVRFHLTSGSVMNSFFVPRLGSQIYTMAGMETKLSLLADEPGDYEGMSANYSGEGFSDMTFKARAMTAADFDRWVEGVRSSPAMLTMAAYRDLARPGVATPVTRYGTVDGRVYHDALNKCADGTACIDDRMAMAATREALGDAALCGPGALARSQTSGAVPRVPSQQGPNSLERPSPVQGL